MVLGPFLHEERRHAGTDKSVWSDSRRYSQPGKWRLIVDECEQRDQPRVVCLLHYVKVDDVARRVWQLGPGTHMAKIDISGVYRIVPVYRCMWILRCRSDYDQPQRFS